jgi:hypothetical protein
MGTKGLITEKAKIDTQLLELAGMSRLFSKLDTL